MCVITSFVTPGRRFFVKIKMAANRADDVSIVESLADFNVDAASDINSDIGHVVKTVCKDTGMSSSGEVLSSEPFMNKMNVNVESFT